MSGLNGYLRVLHAPIIAMYFPNEAVAGLRRLGHRADYMVFDDGGDGWLGQGWDINLELNDKGSMTRLKDLASFIRSTIKDYDIFHFHSGRTLIPLVKESRWSFVPDPLKKPLAFLDYMDLPLLRAFGKKIVFHFWGCDIRPREKDAIYEYSCCRECHGAILEHCTSGHKEKMARMTRRYGHICLACGDLLPLCPDMVSVPHAIDTNRIRPLEAKDIPDKYRLPKNGKVRIIHSHANAPSRGDVKGTSAVFQAVEELKADGLPVELIYFHDCQREELKYYQMQADIVVDQLRSGSYGYTAVECMALGRPVITYLRDDVKKHYPSDLPVLEANIKNIKDVLRTLITNPEKRYQAGEASRKYAVREHDTLSVAQRLVDIYRSL